MRYDGNIASRAAAFLPQECLFYYVVVWIPFYYPLKLGTLLYLHLS